MTQPASVAGGIVLHVFFQVWPISHPVACLSCYLLAPSASSIFLREECSIKEKQTVGCDWAFKVCVAGTCCLATWGFWLCLSVVSGRLMSHSLVLFWSHNKLWQLSHERVFLEMALNDTEQQNWNSKVLYPCGALHQLSAVQKCKPGLMWVNVVGGLRDFFSAGCLLPSVCPLQGSCSYTCS